MSAELYKEIFEDDYLEYKELLDSYNFMKSESGYLAYEICIKSASIADRWKDISTEIEKVKERKPNLVKTEFKDWCYANYRIIREIWTHSRMVWKNCEDNSRYNASN